MPPRKKRARLLLLISLPALLLALGAVAALWFAGGFPMKMYDEFREVRVVGNAEARPFRILAIGDSFMTKWPLKHYLRKDLFVYADERELGLVVDAMGGWGPFDYRAAMGYRATGAGKFEPSLVILFYHAGNDLTDTIRVLATPLPEHLQDDKTGGTPPPTHPPTGLQPSPSHPAPFVRPGGGAARQMFLPLSCGSHDEVRHPKPPEPRDEDYNWKRMKEHGVQPELITAARQSLRDGKVGDQMVSATLLSSAVANPTLFTQNLLINDEMSKKSWIMVRAQLKWLFDLARMSGADIALVIIPSMVQVSRAQEPFLKKANFTIDEKIWTGSKPQKLLRAYCFEHKVMVLDLLPFLKKRPDREKLYWKNDDHLSGLGHQVAFKLIKEKLLDPWYRNKQRSPKDRAQGHQQHRAPPGPPARHP